MLINLNINKYFKTANNDFEIRIHNMQPDIMDLGSNLDETQAYLRIFQEIYSKIQVIYFS